MNQYVLKVQNGVWHMRAQYKSLLLTLGVIPVSIEISVDIKINISFRINIGIPRRKALGIENKTP